MQAINCPKCDNAGTGKGFELVEDAHLHRKLDLSGPAPVYRPQEAGDGEDGRLRCLVCGEFFPVPEWLWEECAEWQ